MKSKKKVLTISLFAVALLLVFGAAVGGTLAYFSAVRQARGTIKFDSGIAVDYYGFADSSIDTSTVWSNNAQVKLFRVDATSDSVVPNQQINIPSANIGVNASSVDFYARAKIEYRFYDNIDGGAQHIILDRTTGEEVITDFDGVFSQSATSLFTSNWALSNDGWYYYSVDGVTPTLIMKDDNNNETTTDGPVAVFNGSSSITMAIHPNYLSQNAGERVEGGGYPYIPLNGIQTEVKRIEATLVLDVIQGEANLISTGWQIVSD